MLSRFRSVRVSSSDSQGVRRAGTVREELLDVQLAKIDQLDLAARPLTINPFDDAGNFRDRGEISSELLETA